MRCGRCAHRYPANVGPGSAAFGFGGPAGPAYSAWRPPEANVPIRVYLDIPSGVTLQLMVVQGYDVWEPREDDPKQFERVRRFHTFGPAHALVPPVGTVIRVEPDSPDVRIIICRYQDMFGAVRFGPMEAPNHTNN